MALLTGFLESPVFPACPKFGYTSSADYSVDIIETAGGDETRNLNWSEHRRTVTLTVGPGEGGEEEIDDLYSFYQVVGGRAYGFRVLDYADYVATDQPLVEAIGVSPTSYQLTKRYTQNSSYRDKSIYKPFGTIVIKDNGVTKISGVDYDLDMTSGLVELNFTPVGALTWSGQFHIPCRFDSDFPVEILNRGSSLQLIKSVSFTLKELRFEDD